MFVSFREGQNTGLFSSFTCHPLKFESNNPPFLGVYTVSGNVLKIRDTVEFPKALQIEITFLTKPPPKSHISLNIYIYVYIY